MIYQSTGAFPNSNMVEVIAAGDYDFISAYELSSGPFIGNIESYLAALSCHSKLAIHNYFPVPETPFVLNLSSQNPQIIRLSLAHIKHHSITLPKELSHFTNALEFFCLSKYHQSKALHQV